MNWIAVFGALPMLFTLIKQLVEEFETDAVPGPKKKQAVMDLLKAAVDTTAKMGIPIPGSVILTLADALIDVVVAGYNLIGKFEQKPQAVTIAG